MARNLKRKPLLDGRHANNLGYVNSVDEAHKLIEEFETGLTTKFSFCKADKGFGNTGVYIALWHTKLCFHVQIEHSTRMSHCC